MKPFRDKASPHLIAWCLVVCNILITMSSDIHLPALPFLVEDLHTTKFLGQMVFIIFFIGASLSRMIWGPVSDAYGRRTVLYIMLALQVPAQLFCIFANSIYSLLFWRAFQSLGAGVISVIGVAIIADIFKEKERAKYYALLELSFPVAFIIAPILGAFLLDYFGTWRACFAMVFVFLIIICILCHYIIPETQPIKSQESFKFSSYIKVITNLEFFAYSSIISLIIASYILYVVNAPFIFINQFNLSTSTFAIYQIMPMIFNFAGFYLYKLLMERISIAHIADIGIKLLMLVIPFYAAIAFSILPHKPQIIISAVCLQCFIVPLLLPSFTSKCMDLFPKSKGLTSSCLGAFRSLYQVSISTLFTAYVGVNISYVFLMNALIIATAVYSYFYVKKRVGI